MIELLESGCALIVGTVTATGAPCAGRGWGLRIGADGTSAHLLLDAAIIPKLGHEGDAFVGTYVAVTGCDVETYRSLQVKGPVTAVLDVTEDDRRHFAAYSEAYFSAIQHVDRIPREFVDRMAPTAISALTFDIVDIFDQTPGPSAGRVVAR